MPRESYRTDDEDDDRRAAASGGGVPGWVWVLGGGGVLAAVVVLGLGFFAVSSRREAAVQHEVARAEMTRADVGVAPMKMAEARVIDNEGEPGRPEVLALARVARAYKTDSRAAEKQYGGRRLQVSVVVRVTGEGWVGAAADLGAGLPRGMTPNVIFHLGGAPPAPGETVVIDGRCVGLNPDPMVGSVLTFTDCRVVRD